MKIRRLKIKRFRGIEALQWTPSDGLNCILGPGDGGKSTVLDAIAMLLSPAPGRVASEYDYFQGDVGQGYVVEALVGDLHDDLLSAWPVAPLWTWMPDTQTVQAAPDPAGEAVLCVRVRGTADLEVEHLVIDPSEGEIRLSPSKRQLFGLSVLGPAFSAFRELRMSRGSLLSRNISSDQIRALVTDAVQASREGFDPPPEVKKQLGALSKARDRVAPGTGDLSLGIASPRGQTLLGMVGLFSSVASTDVPLASAGLGTQQLTLFTLANAIASSAPLFVIDEIESGLEPFRQRDLIARIRAATEPHGQAFLTTHSPAAIGEMEISELHRIQRGPEGLHDIAQYSDELGRIKKKDPEALLSRLAVVVEGATEVGLLRVVLGDCAAAVGTTLGALGLQLVDGQGQPNAFGPINALRRMNLRCGAFLDSETHDSGSRKKLSDDAQVAFGTYSDGPGAEAALAQTLSLAQLDALIATPTATGYDATNDRLQLLNQVAGHQTRTTVVDLALGTETETCRTLFASAASQGKWFKSEAGGEIVARYLLDHVPQSPILRDVRQFWANIAELISDHVPSADGDGNS